MALNHLTATVRQQSSIHVSRQTQKLSSLFLRPSNTSCPSPYISSHRLISSASALPPFRLRSQHQLVSAPLTQRRSLFGQSNPNQNSQTYSQLAHLEATANNNPRSASAQNAFYSALLRAGRPDLVAERHESGKFATNAGCEAMFVRAVARLESTNQATNNNVSGLSSQQLQGVASSVGGRLTGQQSGQATQDTGSKKNPVYVVLEQSMGTTLFTWLRFLMTFGFTVWSFYVVMTFFLTMMEGGGIMKKMEKNKMEAKAELQTTRFADVHGCEEAKEELLEIVDFLKDPEKYGTLGGKLPKGVLLVGPPGTGKTLLARAVAGEAGVPFFYMSGSEFDEVYVGVGAKRIRELFAAARGKAPAIVFIDELDAIGGKRNERDAAYSKQTLNQLLTDLDGFNQASGVIFLAATNFPQLLDKALTRPGRFDRQVTVGLPDVRGRIAILDFYLKKMNINSDVDPSVLARGTPGFSGAELENLTNAAAIHASKRRAQSIEMIDFEWAKDRLMMGAERKSAVIMEKDKIMTAYHEGGHALVAMYTPHADPLYKATIMPRGHALGITFQLPEMDRVSMAKREYLARIDVCMGGKVAEELIYGPEATTSGASSDIEQATQVAYQMVTQLGMSAKLGNVDLHSDYPRLPNETKQVIWEEVRRLVEEGKARAEEILTSRRNELELLAKALVEYETLGKDEMELVVQGKKLTKMLKSKPDPPTRLPGLPLPKPKSDPPTKPSPPPSDPSGPSGIGLPIPGTQSPRDSVETAS